MRVELIPVIEIGLDIDENDKTHQHPLYSYWTNSKAWEEYYRKAVKRSGYNDYKRIEEGHPFYRLSQINSKQDLLKIIDFHLGADNDKVELKQSCALFGGYALVIDKQVIFTPQCCGTLADFSSWKSIIQDNFKEGYICHEGHPCPRVERRENQLFFIFENEWEDFTPPAINSVVERKEMIKALEICERKLIAFEEILNSLSEELNQKGIADILIYEKEIS